MLFYLIRQTAILSVLGTALRYVEVQMATHRSIAWTDPIQYRLRTRNESGLTALFDHLQLFRLPSEPCHTKSELRWVFNILSFTLSLLDIML
jgi:hypothetical protein